MKIQWVQCEACGKKLRPAVDSALRRGEVGHFVSLKAPKCCGRLVPIGPVERS